MREDQYRLQAEYERQLREEALRFYKPHKKQLLFHQSQASVRGLFGGNQSGKSWAGGMDLGMTVGKVHPYRPNYSGAVFARDCCVDFGVLKAVLIPTYKSILPRGECPLDWKTYEGYPAKWPGLRGGSWKTAWSEQERTIYLADGSFVEFKSYEQGKTNRDSFAGPPRHIIREDEEAPEYLHSENLMRQVTTGQNIILTMTPLNYSQWVYASVYEASAHDPRIDVFQMSSFENPNANKEMLARMEKDISDPVERAARLHGEFTYAQGRVWKEYGDHNLVDPFQIPRDWHRSVVIDPHPQKPTAVNWFAEDHNGILFGYREGDYSGTVEEICDNIKIQSGGEYIDAIYIDPSSRQSAKIRGQGALSDEFRKHLPGIIEANNAREIGWEVVRRMVRNNPGTGPRLVIMKNCPITDFQMRNYSWKPPLKTGESRGKADVVKRNDDHPDNVRYRCMASFASRKASFSGFDIPMYAN